MENKDDVVVEKTAEEKLAELEAKLAEAEAQNKNLKATLSEKNSENATKKREIEEWKNKYNSTLDEAQQAELKRKEIEEERNRRLEELERKAMVSDYKSMYLSLGYSEDLAQSSAEAKYDKNDDVLFANQKSFLEEKEKALRAEILNQQPSITSGAPLTTKDSADADKKKLYGYFGLKV